MHSQSPLDVPLSLLEITVGKELTVGSDHLTVLIDCLLARVPLYDLLSPDFLLSLLLNERTMALVLRLALVLLPQLLHLSWEPLSLIAHAGSEGVHSEDQFGTWRLALLV